jgi:hypothetical protein
MEISVEVSQKTKSRATICSWAYLQRNIRQHAIEAPAHPCLLTVLFTISKPWNQPRCPLKNEWVENVIHIHMWSIIWPQRMKEHNFQENG